MKLSINHKENHTVSLLIIGTILFVFYYVADCALDSLFFGEESLAEQLFSPSPHEVSIRVLSGLFLFSFYIVAAYFFNKNRNLQDKLKIKSDELLANNKELEAYNFALSHELCSSLTRIITAKEILQKKSRKCTAPACRELLNHIDEGCLILSGQINGMLNFSEANRSRIERQVVSIDNIVRDIAKEVAANTDGEALDIQIDNNLETECDPQLMSIAIKNLLENAVKFRATNRPGEIQIGREYKRGVPIYYVRDNGIGFRQEEADRLFRPFEKNNHARLKPGSGVGLATTKTIIERHGGRIWAEGQPEKGATFYFTL